MGGGDRGPCQLPQKCLIFESAAFLFPVRERAGENVWLCKGAPGLPPSRRTRARKSDTQKGKGNRHSVWRDCLVFFFFFLKNDFRVAFFFPPSTERSSLFSVLLSHGKAQKKKVSSGHLLPSFLGCFPATNAVGSFCTAFFSKQRAIACARPDREFACWSRYGVA